MNKPMELWFKLPNGRQIDLFDQGPDGMKQVCQNLGQYDLSVMALLCIYKREPNPSRQLQLSDEIRDQSYFFAGQMVDADEQLQQTTDWIDLGEQIFQSLIQSVSPSTN